MKNRILLLLTIVAGIAFLVTARAQEQVITGQKQFTGVAGKIEDFGLNYANSHVAGINDGLNDLDKKQPSGDLQEGDGVAVQKQSYEARLAMQNKINDALQKIQEKRDTVSQYIAAHPADMKAVDAAKKLAGAYNQVVEMANKNSDKIDSGKTFLENHGAQNLPVAPNHVDKLAIPAAMPSEKEMQGNKPPGPGDVSTDTPKPPKDADDLRNDLQTSQNTKANIDKLIDLSQQYVDKTAQKAKDNPGDLVAQANAENALADLDKLQAWRQKINNQMTDDLNQLHSSDKSDNRSSGGPDPIAIIAGFPIDGGMMGVDQGDESTQKFVDGVTVNNGSSDTASSGKSSSGPSDQVRDNARDNARDTARAAADSARDAANAARDNAHSARGAMSNCPDGH